MHQQLWGYKVEEKLYVGVREQKRLTTTGIHHAEAEGNNAQQTLLPVQFHTASSEKAAMSTGHQLTNFNVHI
jgi:hypothetical protein